MVDLAVELEPDSFSTTEWEIFVPIPQIENKGISYEDYEVIYDTPTAGDPAPDAAELFFSDTDSDVEFVEK